MENTNALPTATERSLERADAGVCKRTTIGGQALIEGLLMLGPEQKAIACRKPDGEIVLTTEPRKRGGAAGFNVPFLRGAVRLISQMKIGISALTYSAEIAADEEDGEDEEPPGRFERFLERHHNLVLGLTVALSLALSIGLFILLPSLITDLIRHLTGLGADGGRGAVFLLSLIEGLVRMGIFLSYMWLTSKAKDIRRVWQYHGAEHKTIACYEAGEPLTVANVRDKSRFHPRCGTSFIFLVMFVSILLFSVVGRYGVWLNVLIRLALLPLVAGICYELIRYAGGHDNAFTRAVSKPGLALQRLTTAEPDDDMIEVAIAAMSAVIPDDPDEDNW